MSVDHWKLSITPIHECHTSVTQYLLKLLYLSIPIEIYEKERTKKLWREADAVCFDVDSTVCKDEAIDELAKFAGKEKEVAEKTQKAMSGGMTFKEALHQRLELIQPTVTMIHEYLYKHHPNFTPGIKDLIRILHNRQIAVYLISGGFYTLLEPIAKELNICLNNVFANRLLFYFNGKYAGFDENQPVCHQNGKAEVISYLKENYGYQKVVMIGDGITDLMACPPADGFIGFGGNSKRNIIKDKAGWFVTDFYELIEELQN
ncbi:phosphoserine phosphatase-like isoform X2 [Centruroides sculpturatus]|uniref:phosphoserine phosphatase-like isoform X2 n=1 Tax=Centruroides sculpturatus TaxID=218467 RepID=UPI000C6EECDC|nr:phosphoserine phosphatase-like isoform X2 [Centruroides sculpturatus]